MNNKNTSIQLKRLESQMHQIVNDFLTNEIEDPFLASASFTFVKLTNDKSLLTVYVDHLDRIQVNDAVLKLNKISGLFRNELAKQLSIYKVPVVKFINDKTIDQAARIEAILEAQKKDKKI